MVNPKTAYEHEEDPTSGPGYRTYEVYQRERVGETTNLIKPRQLISDSFLDDPFPLLEVLRENYPCYRDWLGNRFWITRYDDVTSVFADDQNYETRPKCWFYGSVGYGRDLWDQLPVQRAFEKKIDDHIEEVTLESLSLFQEGNIDLSKDFAARIPLALWGKVLNLSTEKLVSFSKMFWTMQRGTNWNPELRESGRRAMEMLTSFLRPIFSDRQKFPEDDMISAIAQLELPDAPPTVEDLVVTLLERDYQTLHGGLSNLWFNLLSAPDQMAKVKEDNRLMKFAWLETLRHSPPVLSADRFAKQEVERFGRLIPKGGLLHCSSAAANRDPRYFHDPDSFIVGRSDLCQREPRGQYRADGLPAGIAFELGKPSVHPAVPKERPRSLYALMRDTAVTASLLLLDSSDTLIISGGEAPVVSCRQLGEMWTCWQLPTTRL